MENNYIELLKPTPKFHSKKCKFLAFILRVFLEYTTVFSGLLMWYLYDYFFGGATLLVVFIVMGIVRSYMRNSSIPVSQREYHYNDKGIAEWFLSRHFCYEAQEDSES
jgi:hypothetical protein